MRSTPINSKSMTEIASPTHEKYLSIHRTAAQHTQFMQVALLSFEGSRAVQFPDVQHAIQQCWQLGAETSTKLWRMIGGTELDAQVCRSVS